LTEKAEKLTDNRLDKEKEDREMERGKNIERKEDKQTLGKAER
jgi:hypothetical protein